MGFSRVRPFARGGTRGRGTGAAGWKFKIKRLRRAKIVNPGSGITGRFERPLNSEFPREIGLFRNVRALARGESVRSSSRVFPPLNQFRRFRPLRRQDAADKARFIYRVRIRPAFISVLYARLAALSVMSRDPSSRCITVNLTIAGTTVARDS